jgi:hypothetical protein
MGTGCNFVLALQPAPSACRCWGTFNLLWAAVQYLHRFQKGLGASSVSFLYAKRCHQKYDLLWQLPTIAGLPNPMPDEERVNLPHDAVLHEFKVRDSLTVAVAMVTVTVNDGE